MKIVGDITFTHDTIEIETKEPVLTEKDVRIFGIKVGTRTVVQEMVKVVNRFPGRTMVDPVIIDFEDADPVHLLVMCADVYDFTRPPPTRSVTLPYKGKYAVLDGLVPTKRLRLNIWEVSVAMCTFIHDFSKEQPNEATS